MFGKVSPIMAVVILQQCSTTSTHHKYTKIYRVAKKSNATSYASPYGPLQPNVMSSIKPEVHNVSQCRPRRTEPRPQGIYTTNLLKIGAAVQEICSQTDTHTHRQTDRLITILCSPTGLE